jgi:hypothetical protein
VDNWLSPWRFGALLAFLLVVTFPTVLAGLEIFGYLDFGQFAFPSAFYHRESFWRGEVPLWNPFNSCGVPFLAQWNTLTLYPPSLFYLLLPFPWSLGVFLLLHLFWGGLGMYFLASRWTENRLAGAVAGAVFAFNGFSWYALLWPHITAAMAWMPWLLLSVDDVIASRARRATVLAGLAGAMQLLTGGAEVILLTWGAAAVLILPQLLRGSAPRLKMLTALIIAGSLAVALAAVQLMPFLGLLAHSQRSAGYGNPNMATLPLTGIANYFVPVFHCLRNPQGLFVPPNHWTASYYLGVGVLLLAFLAVWKAGSQRVWLLIGLTAFSLLMALGKNGFLYGWVTSVVPVLGFMRFPIKFVILATFTIPLLAAFGLAWLLRRDAENPSRRTKQLMVAAGVVAGAIGVVVLAAYQHPVMPNESGFVATNGLARLGFLLVSGGCLIGVCKVRDLKAQTWLQIALIAALWFDVRTHNADLSPTVRPGTFEPDAARNYLQWGDQVSLGVSRVMQSRTAFHIMMAIGFRRLEDDTAGRRLSQFFDFNLLDHVPKVDGFYSMDLKEFSDIFKQLYYATNSEPERFIDFLGVSLISSRTNATEWLARDSFLPLVTGGQRAVFADDQATLEGILSQGLEPRNIVYLPPDAQGQVKTSGPAKLNIQGTKLSAGRLEFDVVADAAGLAVIAQTFYYPWHAWIDDKPVPLWRANYAFQALNVPAGTHHVCLKYQDNLFRCGAVVSAVALLACAVGWFGKARRQIVSGSP